MTSPDFGIIRAFTTEGIVEFDADTLSEDERSLIGKSWNAGNRYIETGSTNDWLNSRGEISRGLVYFAGMPIGEFEFSADPDEWADAAMQGELDQGPYDYSTGY